MRLTWRSFGRLSGRELHDLLKLRADVFVVEQACPFADIDGRDPEALHLLARTDEGGPLAGTLRLFAPSAEESAVLGRVATAGFARGTGLGRALMAEGVAEARRRFGPAPIRIGAQARLERFYAGFGFARVGADYVEDGIAHCAMVLGSPSNPLTPAATSSGPGAACARASARPSTGGTP